MSTPVPARAQRLPWMALIVLLWALLAAPAQDAYSQARPAPLPQPTEAQLGVPVYPGARYDGVASAGMTQPDTAYWLFLTRDPPAQVAKFYAEKTGKAAQDLGGSFIIAVKGKAPFPEHGIIIEPNKMFPTPDKTVITVSKAKP